MTVPNYSCSTLEGFVSVDDIRSFSIKAKHYKCFGETEQGFDRFESLNLIIGRNNSGKSTLIELLRHATSGFKFDSEYNIKHLQKSPEVIADAELAEDELRSVFREDRKGGLIGGNHWEFGKKHLGKNYKWRLFPGGNQSHIPHEDDPAKNSLFSAQDFIQEYGQKLTGARRNRLEGRVFVQLAAERNIAPEMSSDSLTVKENGEGATNLIQRFMNDQDKPREVVEKYILDELNHILEPDLHIDRILCRRLKNQAWEIFLEEESKGMIALSQSGSGLKTVILVLVLLRLLPLVRKVDVSNFVFAFEELENNLHPAILRRLLLFLYNFARSSGCILVLTTHSNVEIDFFASRPNSQIIRVTHDGKESTVTPILSYLDSKELLYELGVRASDLLQSNGVIWVEGPSDRIYINRWIELWSNGELQEGLHYQCVFYGGRLLSHLEADSPLDESKLLNVLGVNGNSMILIDSDKTNASAQLNHTKQRVVSEFEKHRLYTWITAGNEIENYLPASTVGLHFGFACKTIPKFSDLIKRLEKETGKSSINKPTLASEICSLLTKEDCSSVLDLDIRMTDVCRLIRRWNE